METLTPHCFEIRLRKKAYIQAVKLRTASSNRQFEFARTLI